MCSDFGWWGSVQFQNGVQFSNGKLAQSILYKNYTKEPKASQVRFLGESRQLKRSRLTAILNVLISSCQFHSYSFSIASAIVLNVHIQNHPKSEQKNVRIWDGVRFEVFGFQAATVCYLQYVRENRPDIFCINRLPLRIINHLLTNC